MVWWFGLGILTTFAFGRPQLAAALTMFGQLLVLAFLVLVHVYAIRARRPKVLIGFWTTILVVFLVFVVSCFTLIWGYGR